MINGTANVNQNIIATSQPIEQTSASFVPPTATSVNTPTPSNKKSPIKIILAALVFLVVLVGGGAAYFLSQQSTDLRQQASTGSIGSAGEVGGVPSSPPPGGYSIRCASNGSQNGNTFSIDWSCWGDIHMQWARPDRIDWPGYPAAKPWKIAAWHCPRPNTSDPNNPKTCNYGDPGAVRVFITDKNILSYSQGRRDGNGGDGSPCDINSSNQTHCVYHNVTSSVITANAYNNCGFLQADIFVPHPAGHPWDFGGDKGYQVLGAYTYDFGKYDNCERIIPSPSPSPSPTPTPSIQCPSAPTANCVNESDGSLSANVLWQNNNSPIGTKYIIRADHQTGNVAQCINPNSQQPVGWFCPASVTSCLPGQVCDDRFLYATKTANTASTGLKIPNIKSGDTYSWAVQVDPSGCRIEAGTFRCTLPSPSPSPTPSPSSSPITYSCNSTCSTNGQCQTVNKDYICYKPSVSTQSDTSLTTDKAVLGVSTDSDSNMQDTSRQIAATAPGTGVLGNCRLAAHPTSTTCQAPVVSPTPSPTPTPPVGPMCINITLNSPNNPPKLGDAITLTCGAVKGIDVYEFRLRQPNGSVISLNGANNSRTSQQYQISADGKFAAQCRICPRNNKGVPECQEWEPLAGVPSASPSLSVNSSYCRQFDDDVAKCTDTSGCAHYACSGQCHPHGTSNCNAGCTNQCATPSPSPSAQCNDQKCAESVLCLIGISFCSTSGPAAGQCVCPNGADEVAQDDSLKSDSADDTSKEEEASLNADKVQ